MKNTLQKKIIGKEKKEIFWVLILVATISMTLLEFKHQDFSPWIQILKTITIPFILTIGFIIFIVFRKKIFVYNTKPTNTDNLREVIVSLVIAAPLTIPILGLTSLTNRTIGNQANYELKGEILKLDSTSVYNKSNLTSTEYSVELIESHSGKKYEFNISEQKYKELKGKTWINREIKKGFWGYLYEE